MFRVHSSHGALPMRSHWAAGRTVMSKAVEHLVYATEQILSLDSAIRS
jgi:hypothetical protein